MKDKTAMRNINIIGAGLGLGLPIEAITPFCTPLKSNPAKQLTDADRERIEAAERKRARKAVSRMKSSSDDEGML